MNIPEDSIFEIISLFIGIILSGVASSTETVVTSIPPIKAKQFLEELPSIYKKPIELWINHPSRVITSILILNNIVNIFVSVLITSLSIKIFSNYALALATAVATVMILLFGEIIPKSFGKAHNLALAKYCLALSYFLYKIEYPAVYVFASIADWFISKSPKDNSSKTITEKDLEFMIDESEAVGAIESMKKEMLSSVFDFDEIVVREIMRPRTDIVALEKHDSIDKALSLAMSTGYSRIPVYDDQIDHIVGIIYSKDLLKFVISDKSMNEDKQVSSIMRLPLFVPESKLVMEVFKDLKRYKNHMAIVIDEYGGTAGLVTLEDILEEIVGEIQDEFDKEESEIVQVSDNSYVVSGALNVDDFIEYFKLDKSFIPEDKELEVDTMSGFLIALLGDLPKVGVKVFCSPFEFTVLEVNQYRIKKFKAELKSLTNNEDQVSELKEDTSTKS